MILEKDSSVLGYPGEISKALSADHHSVCKYDSPKDPNYVTVRNALQSLVSKVISARRSKKPSLPDRRESQDLKSMLAVTDLPDIDYIFFRDQWAPGTGYWLLEEESYVKWSNVEDLKSSLLWLNGGAASGKSILSSFLINTLAEQGIQCQYFFIRFGDRKKKTLNFLLRSIAYQIARHIPDFAQQLLELKNEAFDVETADPRTIWGRIFRTILFRMSRMQPLFWIIDGLDEADDARTLIRFLHDISLSSIPIRVLLVSRETSEILALFQKVPVILTPWSIRVESHVEDLRKFIDQELSMAGTPDFRESVVQRLISGAQNNFLVSIKSILAFL